MNNCERGQEPLKDGMRMSRVAECYYHRQTNPRFNWREKSMVEPEPEIESGARDKNSSILLLPFLILIIIKLGLWRLRKR